MRREIKWPDGHDFAFTVIDDTDGATVENVKPVYDYLISHGILTTKTCWVYPSRDDIYTGQCLQDKEYLEFLRYLKRSGVELGFHNAGSGGFRREETLAALKEYREKLGEYPSLHINHSNNVENLYWGAERFSLLVRAIYKLRRSEIKSYGTDPKSEYFWGDFAKEHLRFIRNRTFNDINTLKADPRLVYRETGKKEYSNYWFSSSDGMRLAPFLRLLTKENIDRLASEHGCCIVYTHFAYEFVDNGILNEDFKKTIDYIASRNGWFVPASTVLNYVLEDREYAPSRLYEIRKDCKWLLERMVKKQKGNWNVD